MSCEATCSTEPVANLLLLIAIAKQIQGQTKEVRKPWLNTRKQGHNIFAALFTTADKCAYTIKYHVFKFDCLELNNKIYCIFYRKRKCISL